jgi:septal ring-binding cell division protein DamX
MVVDYSEKRSVRESVERKPVQKNRPRKEPAGRFLLLSIVVLLFTFGAGVLTGGLLYKKSHPVAPAVAQAPPAKKEESAPVPAKPATAGPDAPLTFYRTLPAGGKGSMGSGLNLKKPEPAQSAPRPAPVAAPAPVAEPAAGAPEAAEEKKEKKEAAGRFVVQVASYREKPEADRAQVKLAGKGVAAYLQESKVADKLWFRIRVGRHLTHAEADELAAKLGKGAVVLSE